MSRDSVMKSMKELVDSGLVVAERTMQGLIRRANRYKLQISPKVVESDLPEDNVVSFPKVANGDFRPELPYLDEESIRKSPTATYAKVGVSYPESCPQPPPKVAHGNLHIENDPVKDEPVKRTKDSCASERLSDADQFAIEFDEIWLLYPRHVARKQAKKSYMAARKRASRETIESAVTKYAQANRNTEERFIKHFSTWLNNDCWEDVAPSKDMPDDLANHPKIDRIMKAHKDCPNFTWDEIRRIMKSSSCPLYGQVPGETRAWDILHLGFVT